MQNYFKIFELEEKYDIDLKDLDSKYFYLQSKYHPDKALSPEEKQQFLSESILLNSGYKILKDDFERAAHLLERHNIYIKDDKAAPKLPLGILEEIMHKREELESTEDLSKLNELYERQVLERKKLLVEISDAFKNINYEIAAISTMQLKYLDNLLDAIDIKRG